MNWKDLWNTFIPFVKVTDWPVLYVKLEETHRYTYEEVEETIGGMDGVAFAGFDDPSETVKVEYDPGVVGAQDLIAAIATLGYPYQVLGGKPDDRPS